MKKNNLALKKLHFKFKNIFSFNKHILKFGTFGFKIKSNSCISKDQETLFRLFLLKKLKLLNQRKIKIRFFSTCFYTKTKLPLESRMGKGKGEVFDFFGFYKKGFVLLELFNISFLNTLRLQKHLNKKGIFQVYLIKK